jgi:hypothetical protein
VLTLPTAIAAATTTQIELTDPDGATYELQLLAATGNQVLARLGIDIETPQGDS